MATSAAYQIGVDTIYDNTQLTTGVTEAKTAMQGLETAIDQTATDASTSFSRVGTSVDSTTTSFISTSGRKLKSAGKVIGGDFASSITTGLQNGDIAGSFSGIISSLAAIGGIGAIATGIGAAFGVGMIKGFEEQSKAFRESINTLLGGVENEFKGSLDDIYKQIRKANSELAVVTELGGGDQTLGFERANAFVEIIGLSLDKVGDVLQGRVNPGTRKTVEQLKLAAEETQGVYKAGVLVGEVETARAKKAQELVGLYELQRDKLNKAKEVAAGFNDLQTNARKNADYLSSSAADYADSLVRGADAAERINAAIINAGNNITPTLAQFKGLF